MTGGTAIDAKGNIYLSDTEKLKVLKITPAGKVSTLIADPRLDWADAMWIDASGRCGFRRRRSTGWRV